jgi:hypothetical protein
MMRCSHKHEIAPHIEKYDELWQHLLDRTTEISSGTGNNQAASSDSLESLLLPLANSPAAKGAFFLTTLPTSLDNIVDNLTTKESATYSEICNRLLDLYPPEQPTDSNTAFTVGCGGRKNGKGKDKSDKIYTYCKSKGFRGTGHLVEDCQTKKRDNPQNAAAAIESNDRDYAFPIAENDFPPN